jgi:hypothetical protein
MENDFDFSLLQVDDDRGRGNGRISFSELGAVEKLTWLVAITKLEIGVQDLEQAEMVKAARELDILLGLYNSEKFATCGDAVVKYYSQAFCGLCDPSFVSHVATGGTLTLKMSMCSEVFSACALFFANIRSYENVLTSYLSRLEKVHELLAAQRSRGPGSDLSNVQPDQFLSPIKPEPLKELASEEQLKASLGEALPWCQSFLPSLTADHMDAKLGHSQANLVQATEREAWALDAAADSVTELGHQSISLMDQDLVGKVGSHDSSVSRGPGSVTFASNGAGAADVATVKTLQVVTEDPESLCPTYPPPADDVLVPVSSGDWCIVGSGVQASLPVHIEFKLVGNLTGVPARLTKPITAAEGHWFSGADWTAVVSPDTVELEPTEELGQPLDKGLSLAISAGVLEDACGRLSASIGCPSNLASPTRIVWDRFGIRELTPR